MEPRSEPTVWSFPVPFWAGVVVLLLLALLPLPYGYYVFLRWAVCAAAVWMAWRTLRWRRDSIGGWLMIGCALLYNPFARVPLEREVWMAVNVATAVLFWWVGRGRRVSSG